jgi:hypothetical protein
MGQRAHVQRYFFEMGSSGQVWPLGTEVGETGHGMVIGAIQVRNQLAWQHVIKGPRPDNMRALGIARNLGPVLTSPKRSFLATRPSSRTGSLGESFVWITPGCSDTQMPLSENSGNSPLLTNKLVNISPISFFERFHKSQYGVSATNSLKPSSLGDDRGRCERSQLQNQSRLYFHSTTCELLQKHISHLFDNY